MPTSDTDFDLSSSPASAFSMGEYTFADVNNLEHCTKYLNQTLVTFGFPASLDLFANDPVSTARTCNCIYSLLQQRQRDVEFRESASEQRQRLLSDISRLEAKVERLESQLQAKDREIATITRTEAKATAAFKAQIEKLQQERDEFQRMVIGNQQVRTQQIHEMKKKEKEYIKLQERLNQVLMEKKKESRSGMEIMNLLQKEGRQRGTWNGKKADNDFYKKIVCVLIGFFNNYASELYLTTCSWQVDACEAKNQELMAENNDLRALLRSMQVDMRDFFNAPNGSSKQSPPANERLVTDPSQSPLGGRTDVFDLPFHMARDQIEESLRTKMSSIKERMVQLQDAQKGAEVTSEATERELELEAQLVEARSIIQEQASIMSKHLAKSERPRESIISSPAECNMELCSEYQPTLPMHENVFRQIIKFEESDNHVIKLSFRFIIVVFRSRYIIYGFTWNSGWNTDLLVWPAFVSTDNLLSNFKEYETNVVDGTVSIFGMKIDSVGCIQR
ncbi:hypothetical protein POTOM_057347 [Populus tomentosa]|uniref:Afadin/alpha-actinin-binding protein n=1 Tax=Populus tomentosa TaxID=118781 RepID=A0A8X8C3C5_POPTO|nr:hypothetical protein POTOM_057347 [Populus tomentosa]